ncbi:MAG: restriction endonuclease subunit S, partial [Blautia sp.]|nr:restriction endonuclease subunit S [Blautia sp.]
MSRLDELIAELCPDGVEFKKIKDVYTRLKGTPITAGKMKEIENPSGEIRVFAGGKTVINAREEDIPNANITRVPAVLVQSRGVIDFVFYEEPFTFKNEMWAYTNRERISVKFLYYVLKNNAQHFRDAASGMGSLPQISLPVTEEFKVPVPPLEVQREIVRVLDNFTFLSAELSAELSARRKQYEYYRNQLLTFNTEVRRIPMGDLFDFKNGLSKGKEFFGRGTPFIRYTDVYNHRSLKGENIEALVECTPDELRKLKVSRGDVLFTRTSETAEDVGWSSVMLDDMDDCVFNGFTIKASPKTDLLWPEYCAYCFATDSFRNYVTKHCAFTTRASLTGSTIADYRLAVPSLAVQKRIAEVLDNFETICNDLGIGLPAEIEARQKQYEYYRDLLLTFAETGS